MPNFMDNSAFQVYAICSTILVLKMFAVAVITGRTRSRLQAFMNPEDARMMGAATEQAQEPPEIQRIHRLHRNDLENIPAFFAIGLIYVLSGASAFAATVYFVTFTVARIGHTIAYLRQWQPWRTIAFAVGMLGMLGMMVQILIVAL